MFHVSQGRFGSLKSRKFFHSNNKRWSFFLLLFFALSLSFCSLQVNASKLMRFNRRCATDSTRTIPDRIDIIHASKSLLILLSPVALH